MGSFFVKIIYFNMGSFRLGIFFISWLQ